MPTSPAKKRDPLTRERILHVASEQFHQKGYDRTSLDDVARALSVTKPSLYYHFENKEDILLGCVTEAVQRLDLGLTAADSTELLGRERLEIFLREYLRVISDNFGVALVHGDDRVMSEEGRQVYFGHRRRLNKHVTDVVAQGMRDGSIAVGDVTLTVNAIFGMFNWVPRWRNNKSRASEEEIHRRFCAILFSGLAPARPRAVRPVRAAKRI